MLLCLALCAGCGKEEEGDVIRERDFTEKNVPGVNFEMVYVRGGTFTMGATKEQGVYYQLDELPAHQVTLTDYHIGKFEVTQGLWEKVMGTTVREQRDKANREKPLNGMGADYPMYYVTWSEAKEFCEKLSELTGRKYALPTEAQWEYAGRGGVKGKGYKFSGGNSLDTVAWYTANSGHASHPVGKKRANELGIHDMGGNVWEWCADWYGEYSSDPQTDPAGWEEGDSRILRGGSWYSSEGYCRLAFRLADFPHRRDGSFGFRVVLLPAE